MVKIIFSRTGKKHRPQYRIIAVDKAKDPWGRSLEILGHHNPHTKETVLNEESILKWIGNGAQPSATVHNLLVEKGVIKDKKEPKSRISKKRQVRLAEKAKEKEEKKAAAADAKKEEAPKEEKPAAEEKKEEEPPAAEAKKEAAPKEEKPAAEEKKEESKEEKAAE